MQSLSLCNRLARMILDTVFPARCLGCGRLYLPAATAGVACAGSSRDRRFRGLVADALCADCARIEWIDSPMCTVCGEPFASRQGVDHPCADCRRGRFSFDSARSVGIYSGALKALIHAFKYRGMAHLTAPLGRLMWERMSSIKEMGDADGFVSVPLHPRRKRRRGFNQARLLMQAWPAMAAKEGGRPGLSEISAGLLIRARATRPQTGLDPRQRRANLRDAFRVRGNRSLEGRKLVIVDDVMTTGATADACARVLKRAGAASVNVFTLARAV